VAPPCSPQYAAPQSNAIDQCRIVRSASTNSESPRVHSSRLITLSDGMPDAMVDRRVVGLVRNPRYRF
jgi:hypothetical protein